MTLAIQTLHRQVTQQLQNHDGELTGKLKGNVAANKEGTFQGLTVTSGARDTEKAFAQEVLKHVQNIALSQDDVVALHKSATRFNHNNFDLRSIGHGESRLVALRSDQLTLNDAKILLDAALRQHGGKEAADNTRQQLDTPPPLPPRQAPVVPVRDGRPGAGTAT
ncbi:hypothetical protein [Aeromonas salmonicida]|uniref:hypothetical protein n=1 Tax=Aeromonas salmonicida TaxID=645 RepID=UPI003D1D96D3